MFPALTPDEKLTLETTSLSSYGGNFDLCQLAGYQIFVIKKKKKKRELNRRSLDCHVYLRFWFVFFHATQLGVEETVFEGAVRRPCPEQGQEWKRRVQNRSKIANLLFSFTERENMKTNSTCSYEEVNRFCLENHRKLAVFHQNRYRNVITYWTNHLASDQPAMYVKFSGSRTLRKIWANSLEFFFLK